jgi:hypothetical protein
VSNSPPPASNPIEDALVALLGAGVLERLLKLLASLTAANPHVNGPPNGIPIPAGSSMTAVFDTDRTDLHYATRVYELPDVTTDVFHYENINGAPYFAAQFPGYLFKAGRTYRVKVEVYPDTTLGNTSTRDYPCVTYPLYQPADDDPVE